MRYYDTRCRPLPPAFSNIQLTYGQQTDILALKQSIHKAAEALRASANIVETSANLLALNDLTNRLTNILKEAKVYG